VTSLTLSRLQSLLDRARATRITVVGDAMLDAYLHGDVERISPEAPVPVVRIRSERHALGGAANVAQNVIAVGASCELIAAIGDDPAGRVLRTMLAEIGAPQSGLATVARCTTRKTRVVARAQQMLRFDEEVDEDLDEAQIDVLLNLLDAALARSDALVLEDYNKGVLTPRVIRAAIEGAQARGLPVIVDPKYRNFFEYRGATIFKPNRRELEAALGAAVDVNDQRALPDAVRRLGVDRILLTLGDRGMVLYSADGEVARVPTVAREVYDVVGAGDTVTAYLAAMLAAGATAAEAAIVANIAAGIEVGKLGAVSVGADELLSYVKEHSLHS
jgi:D-beta-D-heptose 7-phosphate kinase/D-beta-D-heptose 1-phosphate adenosyltransferase